MRTEGVNTNPLPTAVEKNNYRLYGIEKNNWEDSTLPTPAILTLTLLSIFVC